MEVKCCMCNGQYILKYSKYGYFCSCSNYPKCKSKISLDEFMKKYFDLNGINIYKWKEECNQCHQNTNVISYFLLYELPGLDVSYMNTMNYINLGKIPILDNYLLKKYSLLANGQKVHNICEHCGNYKSINTKSTNYIVDQLWHREMDKHLIYNISKNELEITQEDFKNIL